MALMSNVVHGMPVDWWTVVTVVALMSNVWHGMPGGLLWH